MFLLMFPQTRPDFLMKVDDDSFVNVPALWKALKHREKDSNRGKGEKYGELWDHLNAISRRFRDGTCVWEGREASEANQDTKDEKEGQV